MHQDPVAEALFHPPAVVSSRSPPQMCWAQRPQPPVNIDDATEVAYTVLNTMETSWSLQAPMLVNSWTNAANYEGLEQEAADMWLSLIHI